MVELGGLHAELLHAVDIGRVLRYRIGGSLSHSEQVQRAAIPAVEEQLVACRGMVVGLWTRKVDLRGDREEEEGVSMSEDQWLLPATSNAGTAWLSAP